MPRLGSKKSRNGCTQCKARRVKCDELRPCGACAKHNVECSLLSQGSSSYMALSSPHVKTSSPTELTPPATSETIRSTPGSAADEPMSPGPSVLSSTIKYESIPTPTITSSPSDQWMYDLELMHHYTAHAYLTLPGVQSTKQIWGYAVPQESFKFAYLMHSMLAFSANHLAYLNPSRAAHYRLLAGAHQAEASTGLNVTVPEIRTDNCQAVFVCALLVIYNAFADARSYTLDGLHELFQLVRGMVFVVDKRVHIIQQGPFAAIIRPLAEPPTPQPLLTSILVELQSAETRLLEDPTLISPACLQATSLLRRNLYDAMEGAPHPAVRTTLYWPNMLDAEMMEMLRVRTEPNARELLHRYCRIMEFAASDFWFFHRWRGISQQSVVGTN